MGSAPVRGVKTREMVDLQKLERIIEDALGAVALEFVDFEYTRDGQGWVLRIYIDQTQAEGRAQRGVAPRRVTHEDCARASRHLGTVLDVEDPIDTAYRLEVSSPGVLRALRKVRDFERFIGWRVKVQLKDGLGGRRKYSGELVAVTDEHIVVDVDGQTHELPHEQLAKARLDEEY